MRRKSLLAILALSLSLGLFGRSSNVRAFQVPPLPGYNLVKNPWFRSVIDPSLSGLDGWTDAAGKDKYWSTSQKESNPSPDIFVSGVCEKKPVYCGTSARLKNTPGQSGGVGVPGTDAYLNQIVAANKASTKLLFYAHWVSHRIDPAEVKIYGANSPNGPWEFLWQPLYHVQDQADDQTDLWTNTGFLEEIINKGYGYYKLEIHARLPDDNNVGFKITGIYFTAIGPGDPIPPIPNEFLFVPIVLNK